MAEEQFGRPITLEHANQIFDQFRKIKARCTPKFQQVLQGDNEALRYYCGLSEKEPMDQDWGFVFSKETLTNLLNSMLPEENCVFVFYGARVAGDTEPADPPLPPNESGRPTIMMFPARYIDGVKAGEPAFFLGRDRGVQYPGTGGDHIPDGAPNEIPETFPEGSYGQ